MFSAGQFKDVPRSLCWEHCRGSCQEKPTESDSQNSAPRQCSCSRQPLLNAFEEHTVVFVGGGLSSIEAAKIVLKEGGRPLLLERSAFLGGIWVTAANPESRVQVDPVSFRAVDDESPVVQERDTANPFDSCYPTRATVLQRLASSVEKAGLRERTLFNTEVLDFEKVNDGSGRIRLRVRQNSTHGFNRPSCRWPDQGNDSNKCPCCESADGVYTVFVRQLHLRTGSLTHGLHRGLDLKFPGVEGFEGVVRRGMGGDVSLEDFQGKRVVVVGMGAFGVENVRRALRGGASSVTLLSRRFDKLLFPERVSYLLRSRLQASDAFEDENLTRMWRDVATLVRKASKATGLEHVVLNKKTTAVVDGEPHFIFSRGLPSMSSNCIYLAHHYGLVEIFEDEIARFDGAGVGLTTKAGRHLEADVVLLCVGFGTDEKLMEGHVVSDSFFVDDTPSITHNLRGDRVNGQNLIGPRCRAVNFLISYYEDAQEYERPIVRMNAAPEVFEEFKALNPDRNFGVVSSVDYFTTLELSDKLLRVKDPVVVRLLEENRQVRASMYDELLPEADFIALDRENWDRLSHYFATKTGKEVLSYPFDAEARVDLECSNSLDDATNSPSMVAAGGAQGSAKVV